MQGIANFLGNRQAGKFQQGNRMAPVVQLTVVVKAHPCFGPVQTVFETELAEIFECRLVWRTDKVIVTFDPGASKIDRSRHSSDAIVAL